MSVFNKFPGEFPGKLSVDSPLRNAEDLAPTSPRGKVWQGGAGQLPELWLKAPEQLPSEVRKVVFRKRVLYAAPQSVSTAYRGDHREMD